MHNYYQYITVQSLTFDSLLIRSLVKVYRFTIYGIGRRNRWKRYGASRKSNEAWKWWPVAHRWTNQTAEERSTNKPDFTSSRTSNPRHSRLVLPPPGKLTSTPRVPRSTTDFEITVSLVARNHFRRILHIFSNKPKSSFEKLDAESFGFNFDIKNRYSSLHEDQLLTGL